MKNANYKLMGPQDSKKDGYIVDRRTEGDPIMTGRIELETAIGTIIAEVGGDQSYPGLYLNFRAQGSDYEQTVALLECPDAETLKFHFWKDGDENGNDPESMILKTENDQKE